MKKLMPVAIVVILVVMLSTCGSNEDKGSNRREDTPYEQLLTTLREEIDKNLDSRYPDMDILKEDYELLLNLKINEYFYKSMAYGYFTDDFETEYFTEIADEANDICDEMYKYFPKEDVDAYYMMCIKLAVSSIERINMEDFLIGTKTDPDVDAMWNEFFESFLALQVKTSFSEQKVKGLQQSILGTI